MVGCGNISLQDSAFEQLKRQITRGALPPGMMLSERELARRMDMSKTPIRSAMARLASEGFITILPQRGAVVREIPVELIADGFELRRLIEPYVARRIAGRLKARQLSLLRENLRRQSSAIQGRHVTRFAELDMQYHIALVESLNNREMIETTQRLRDRIFRSICEVLDRLPERLAIGFREHTQIFEAIETGDGDRAAQIMTHHLDSGLAAFRPRNL